MDALRRQRQHQRRFAMPGVHRHPLFMRAEKLFFAVGHVEHVVGDGDEIPVAQAHFPAGDLQDLRLAAVAVDHQQLAKTGPIERFGDLQQGMQQRIAAEGQGAGKMQMLLGLTVDDRRNGVGRDRRRQPGEAWPATPEDITLSTEQGKCGPCCSIAPVGRTITVLLLSGRAATSVQLRKGRKRAAGM